MILKTQSRTRNDVLQYAIDDVWSVTTLTFSTGIAADLTSGDAIDPATGAKLTGTATAVAVVADPVVAGSKYVVVFDKLVNLISSEIAGASSAGTTKALELLAANPFVRLV